MLLAMVLCAGTATVQAAAAASDPVAPAAGKMTVYYFDATMGDLAYVRTAAGEDVLIGGSGTRQNGTDAVAALKALGVKDLEAVIATNPNNERTAALVEVVKGIKIKALYAPAVYRSTADYKRLTDAAKQKKLAIQIAKPGVKPVLKNVTASFVGPLRKYASTDKSNGSAVLKLQYGKTSFLFAGEAGTKSETEMVLSGASLKADVLKVAGQGAGATAGPAFLKNVSPRYAVIGMAEGDRPDFPSDKVLQSLAKVKATVYRTDLHGLVTAVSDGKQVEMATERQDRLMAVYKGGFVTVREFAAYVTLLSGMTNTLVSEQAKDPAVKESILRDYIGYKLRRPVLSDADLQTWQERAEQFADEAEQVAGTNAVFKQYADETGLDRAAVIAAFRLVWAAQNKFRDELTEEQLQAAFAAEQAGKINVSVRHILVSPAPPAEEQTAEEAAAADKAALDEALEVKRLLEAGGDWQALALQYSDDPGSQNNGGLYENMDSAIFVPSFREAVEKQPVGAIGDPVKSDFGYHVIKVERRGEPAYGELSAQQKDELKNRVAGTAIRSYFEHEVPKLIADLKIL